MYRFDIHIPEGALVIYKPHKSHRGKLLKFAGQIARAGRTDPDGRVQIGFRIGYRNNQPIWFRARVFPHCLSVVTPRQLEAHLARLASK